MAVKRFTNEEINRADNISIVDYIDNLNLDTKKAGKTLKVEGYGGLYVDPVKNRWNSFSDGKGGGPIQLVMHLESKTWVESVKALLGNNYENNTVMDKYNSKKLEENKEFTLPEKNNTYNHIIAYLIQTRKIDKDIVYKVIKEKKLYEDKKRNCVFVGYDEEDKAKYAGLRGTNTRITFKGEVENSSKGYSFNLPNKGSSILYVFESPIELMSYMTLHQRHYDEDFNFNALSLAGTTDIALERFLKNNDISNISLCLDNDRAGKEATEKIIEKYKDDYIIKIETPKLKDWNESLVYSLGSEKLEIAKGLIMKFISEEYGEELRPFDNKDIEHTGIAHTTTEDGEYNIDIEVDLINYKINKYANNNLLHTDKYEDIDSFIEELKYLDFDNLVYENIQDKIYEEPSTILKNNSDEWDMEL